jgi:undecaprenyl-diphosphatase
MPPPRTSLTLAAVGAFTFAAAAILVHTGTSTLDERLFRVINDVPAGLESVLTPLSRLFLPIGLSVVIAAAAIFVTVRNRSALPLLVGAGAAAGAWLLANLAKSAAQRPRPYEVVADAVLRQSPAHGTSFPSSHTAVAVAVVIALLPFLPRAFRGPAIAYAALVGWSRIYLGVHYPLDVIGGTGIGLLVGGLTLFLCARIAPGWSGITPTASASA